jgi:hypothetical protein
LDTRPRVTVTFDDPAGGNRIASVTIERGASLGGKLPVNLTRDGPYEFYGWFDGAQQYFSDTPVGADVTLTARWADEFVTVSFEFPDGKQPDVPVPDITAIMDMPLGPLGFPATPRLKGYVFDCWLLDGVEFTSDDPVPGDIVLTANWLPKQEFTVEFNPGPGITHFFIKVYENECIDEWDPRFPENPTVNPINTEAFFVSWFDDENREYNGRTPITRNLTGESAIKGKWGLPPYIIDLRMVDDGGEIEELEADKAAATGGVDYAPASRASTIDGKQVIVNETTYNVPYNTNRWRILYRIKFSLPDTFSTEFYTRYTVRARFYANRQGAKTWPTDPDYKDGQFIPNTPATASGYSRDGLLKGVNSPSDDGWGQISWCSVANFDGQGANADTMLQRYNLDRKGGSIDDTWAPLRSLELLYPPYLIVQTSDNYIGHIEITEIVFHNGEKKYTMYTDEDGYDKAVDGITVFEPEP